MRRELHRIEPWSAVRIGFFFGLFSGFLFGLLNAWAAKYLAEVYGKSLAPEGTDMTMFMSGQAVLFFAIIASLLFSLVWSALGGAFAMLYNLVARMFGGLEISVLDHSAQITRSAEHDDGVDHG